ncbi:MAG: prenyltransferase [Acidobacteriota bacterium]
MRARAYLHLLKLNVPELALYSLSAAALAPAGKKLLIVEPLFLLFTFCCTTLTNVLDDIAGYRDGVDRLNVTKAKRNIVKPLLTGELTTDDAWRAAKLIIICAAVIAALLGALSPQPVLSFAALAALIGVVTQYSYGLKLSYRALGELVIIYGIAASILIPYALASGAMPPPSVWWVALMAGLPYAAQIVCSNAVDHDGDKAAGRRTLTVLVGVRHAPWVSLGLFLCFWSAYAAGLALRVLPLGALLWLPLAAGHARYLQLFWREQRVEARLLSFNLIRAQLVLFPIALLSA